MATSPLHVDVRTTADLHAHYRQYLRVLNNRTFDMLTRFVARKVTHNGRRLTHADYCALIYPGTTFCEDQIVADVAQRSVAARLYIEFPTPQSPSANHSHASLPSLVRTASRSSTSTSSGGGVRETSPKMTRIVEHVFYHYDDDWRIDRVWSILDDVGDACNNVQRHTPHNYAHNNGHTYAHGPSNGHHNNNGYTNGAGAGNAHQTPFSPTERQRSRSPFSPRHSNARSYDGY